MEAFIIVDVQNDFLPGGSLEVPEGDEIIPVINRLQPHFDLIVATQDYHPANHGSFAANHPDNKPGEIIKLKGIDQILWPVHCVQGTTGADFAYNLDLSKADKIFTKGENPNVDSYSGFFDNDHKNDTGLNDYLKSKGVDKVYIAGLAADVCVKFTAFDAALLGYNTYVIKDATRAVNLNEGDFEKSLKEMEEKGANIITSDDILPEMAE